MASKQPPWEKHEAIILLETFTATKDGLLCRADAVKMYLRT